MKVVTNHLPKNLEEFRNIPQFDLTKPENTCLIILCAAALPKAYFEDANPANDYQLNDSYLLEITENPQLQGVEERYLRFFPKSRGADSSRSFELPCKDHEWSIWEYSNLFSGIKLSAKEDPWT